MDYENVIAQLESSGEYKVLRKFNPKELVKVVPFNYGSNVGVGVIVDTETTGLESEKDQIIELGLVSFLYDKETYKILTSLESYNSLEEPTVPISPESMEIHGITLDMVKGHKIDDEKVTSILELSDVVIAHNSKFDRPFCENRFSCFTDKSWACSLSQVDWDKKGFSSKKLEQIALKMGFFYTAHRAEMDCFALQKVLQTEIAEGVTPFSVLMREHTLEFRKLWAVGAPFEAKDALKNKGYVWHSGDAPGEEKAWAIKVPESEFNSQLEFLKQKVFKGKQFSIPVDKITSKNNFSNRRDSLPRAFY